jgi:hypothetical protein
MQETKPQVETKNENKPSEVPMSAASRYSRYALAGGICASYSHTILVPIDVVKTRLQVS